MSLRRECCARACSYFPLYPPPLGAMLDTSLGAELDLPCTPDILILPSDLAPFAKLVPVEGPSSACAGTGASNGAEGAAEPAGHVVCVNPGRLVRDKSGATYARLRVWSSFRICPHLAFPLQTR